MASQIIEFPFDAGAYEAADREWLPANLFSVVENLRLDLDGRLGIRPGNTAQAMTTYGGGTLVPVDLANFDGRLVCLGDSVASGLSGATDLFEFVNNGVATWRGAINSVGLYASRLPEVTDVRRVGATPDQTSQAVAVRLAAGGGAICAVTTLADGVSCTVHVFDPVKDQTLLLAQIPGTDGCVVFQGTDFWIVTFSGSNYLTRRFKPGTDKQIQAGNTFAAGGGVTGIAVATLGANWAVAAAKGGSGAFFGLHSGTTGNQAANWSRATTTNRVALAGNTAGTLLSVIYHPSTYSIETFNSTGTTQNGPTALFGGASLGALRKPSATINGGLVVVMASLPNAVSNLVRDSCFQTVTQATHALSAETRYGDAQNDADPVLSPSGNLYAGAANNAASLAFVGSNQLLTLDALMPVAFTDGTLSGASSGSIGPNGSCAIGTKIYWGTVVQSENNGLSRGPSRRPAIYEAETAGNQRRQMAAVANELHLAGGLPLVYDGRVLAEQGFAEQPAVISVTQTAVGSLTALGVYNIVVSWDVFDAKDNRLLSAVSLPKAFTLTGANNSATVLVSAPHSLRTNINLAVDGGLTVRASVWRTIAGGANFFLDATQSIAVVAINGTPLSFSLTQLDTQLRDNEIIYTQAQSIANLSPPPYRFTWRGRERQIIAGLPRAEQWTQSKLLFPNEPVTFASQNRLGFSARANQSITAVGSFETVGITWTASEIAQIPGRGPEHNGTGEFDAAVAVLSPGGCQDWRSLVEAPPGFFFQMAADKLMLLARSQQGGAGEVSWIGQPVRTTLALFPVITGAVHVRSQMLVVFSCTNLAGSAGRLLIYDLRRSLWYVDTVGPATAVSELNGRLAFVQGSSIFLQDTVAGSGTFPGAVVQTGFQTVTKRLGWGHIYRIGLLGSDLGACTVECFIDVDDGVGLRSLGVETFTGTTQTFERFWSLPTAAQRAARFSVRWVIAGTTNTLGLALKAWAAEVQGSPNMTRVGSGGYVA